MNDISDAELEDFILELLGAINVMAREVESAAYVLSAAMRVTPQPESDYLRVPVTAFTRFGDRCEAFANTAFERITAAGKRLGVEL